MKPVRSLKGGEDILIVGGGCMMQPLLYIPKILYQRLGNSVTGFGGYRLPVTDYRAPVSRLIRVIRGCPCNDPCMNVLVQNTFPYNIAIPQMVLYRKECQSGIIGSSP
jgi:hypothetical protein